MKKIKIGDRVIMSKKKIIGSNLNWDCDLPITTRFPIWFSTSHYTVVGIEESNNSVIILDKNLPNNSGNKINIKYLKSLKKDRKKKLLKLSNL